jgi:pimeloyl-ACP methyl ester carboxylesterase
VPTIVRDGRRIHFEREGAGAGLVLVPGLGAGARLFGTLPRRFARLGFTCAAVDPVGLPPSGPPTTDYSFDEAARDVLAVAGELPRPVSLLGTSLGGKVALVAASIAEGGVHRLVLVCSSASVSARARRVYRWFELLATEVDGRWLGEMVAPFLFGNTFHSARPAVVDDIVRATQPSPEARSLMREQARALRQFDGMEMAAACTTRTLCLSGDEDTLTLPDEVEATAARMPNATYRCIVDAGHSLLLESASAFDAIATFLHDDGSGQPGGRSP